MAETWKASSVYGGGVGSSEGLAVMFIGAGGVTGVTRGTTAGFDGAKVGNGEDDGIKV